MYELHQADTKVGSIRAAGCATQASAPVERSTAFHSLHGACEQLRTAATRAEALADKLLGSTPQATGGKDQPQRSGLFGAVQDSAEAAFNDANRIHAALARIEQSVP